MVIVVVYGRRRGTAIVEFVEGILVVSDGGGRFVLPGGGARRGESRHSAVVRELKEETGLIAKSCIYLFSERGRVHKDRYGNRFFDIHNVFSITTEGAATPQGEIKEIAYYKNDNIPISRTTTKILDRYFTLKQTSNQT